MSQDGVLPALDPVIHVQPRLRITVALAALSPDAMIAFHRLQEHRRAARPAGRACGSQRGD